MLQEMVSIDSLAVEAINEWMARKEVVDRPTEVHRMLSLSAHMLAYAEHLRLVPQTGASEPIAQAFRRLGGLQQGEAVAHIGVDNEIVTKFGGRALVGPALCFANGLDSELRGVYIRAATDMSKPVGSVLRVTTQDRALAKKIMATLPV